MHKKALIYFIETLLDLETYSAIDVIFNSLWTDVWIINRQHIFKETLKERARKKECIDKIITVCS